MATDYMVWNLTKGKIRTRMAAIEESIWPLPSVDKMLPANPKERLGVTDYLIEERVVFKDVIEAYYQQTNQEFGTNIKASK